MKKDNILRLITMICCVIGLLISAYFLLLGLYNIGSSSWEWLTHLILILSTTLIIILAIDFIIAYTKTNKGYKYSFVISIVKSIPIFYILFLTLQWLCATLIGKKIYFDIFPILLVTGFFILITIPSVCNTIRLGRKSKIVKKRK